MTSERDPDPQSPRPMTERGPDGRPRATREMEQRATEAEKSREPRTTTLPVTPNGPPD